MPGKVLGVVAGLALGAAVTTAGAATAAASAPSATAAHWHIVKSAKGSNGDFTAVVATGKETGWAFDGAFGPTAWERNGSTWKEVAFPGKSNEYVTAAGATSPSNVWAFTDVFGGGSRVLRWNGRNWSVVRTFAAQIDGASVLAGNDVWVFGLTDPTDLGVWHYNGHVWSQVGKNLDGGSALSASNVWAYNGTNVDHWNGHKWTSTSVKNLLPPRQQLNNPSVTGIIALSASNVYAIGNGQRQDDGGPVVVLHYNGHKWARVAQGNFSSYGRGQQIAADGNGGLWLPMPGIAASAQSFLVHYSGGKLTEAALPVSARNIVIHSVASIPGTGQALAGGYTHAPNNPVGNIVAVVLQYS